MHVVAVVATHGVIPSDLATPCDVLRRVLLPDRLPAYEIRVCGETSVVECGPFSIQSQWTIGDISTADTVVLPGILDIRQPVSADLIDAIRSAAARGARIASICTGAFTLAATGLLDGLRATTHWCAAAELARRYPRITVDPNVLYVDNGQFLTSAGAAAGHDLCLHMVRCDFGAAQAANAARLSVMPLERDGGQAQFIVHSNPPDGSTLDSVLRWIDQSLEQSLAIEDIAQQAAMSPRTLNRRFREQTGSTPRQWVLKARVRRAQALLEVTNLSIEEISRAVGFESPAALRERFQRIVGTNPQAYRRTFASKAAG